MSALLWFLLLAGGVTAIYYLLKRVTEMGGASDRTATDIVDQVRAETDAYRGSRSPGDPPWDGQRRIAPPISDGSGGVGGG
ncbi:MAG: hypothetical protein ACRDXF_08580 [Acidimicrobiia bacterium]